MRAKCRLNPGQLQVRWILSGAHSNERVERRKIHGGDLQGRRYGHLVVILPLDSHMRHLASIEHPQT